MAKSESAQTVLKRLQRIERAEGRLRDITTRIVAQAETLADLLRVAQALVNEGAAKPATRPRAAGTKVKAGTAKRTARKRTAAARRTAAKRASSPTAGAAKPTRATTRRRAPRTPASA